MAGSKHTSHTLRLSREDGAADPLSVTTKIEDPPKSPHQQPVPSSAPSRWASNHFAAQDRPPSPAPYQYTSLNDDLKEIRLLTLHEGDFKADIQISINTVSLFPDSPPTYEALSYVWGSQENPIDIHIGFQTLALTRNLAEALPYLRYRDKPRVLWIDAICVNQQDLKERSRQVRRMADLYRLADRVVVWLGPEKADSKLGVKILGELSSKIIVDWVHLTMKPMPNGADRHWADESKTLPYDNKEVCAICSLISCPWFKRLWIWQEIRLARSNAILICGFDTILWESFRTALFCLYQKAYRTEQTSVTSEQFSNLVVKTYRLADNELNFTFLDTMHSTRHCSYSDAKDRVYAILSLLESSSDAIDIEPDYTKRTSEVYQDVALRYINLNNTLKILPWSGLNERLSEMPTWVPDWRVADTPFPFVTGLASGHTVSEVQYRGSGILSVTGSASAPVQHVDKMDCRDRITLIAEIQRLAPQDVLRGSYIGSGSLLTAYCNTLCADTFSDTYSPRIGSLPQFQPSLEFLSAILQPSMEQVPHYSRGTQAETYLDFITAYCKERSLVKTREGNLCLAPRTAQPGDQVCVLLGCDLPMLLRPTSDSQYQVVGPCYVHGLMNGEAFLGTIPEPFRPICVFDEGRRQYPWVFLDQRTGKNQWNDPRVEALPADDDGEKSRMISWPDGTRTRKLTPGMIERRGVKFQTFDLI